MIVRELTEYLEGCADDAEVMFASGKALYGIEIAINSELNLVFTKSYEAVKCVVCDKTAVAAPFAKQLICYEHWNNFKEK